MKIFACIVALAAIMGTGCKKNASTDAPPAPAAEQSQTAGDAAPAPPPPSPAMAANSDNVVHENVTGEVNPFLTQQLRIFVQQTGRLPQTFAEFAHARLDSLPRAPEGMKWIIDGATQEVKSAPK